MSSHITPQILRLIQSAVSRRATELNYYNIPTVNDLESLNKSNPTEEEINKDYSKITRHFSHPVFLTWLPSYDESSKCIKTAWVKRN
jgi:hypothetical protein